MSLAPVQVAGVTAAAEAAVEAAAVAAALAAGAVDAAAALSAGATLGGAAVAPEPLAQPVTMSIVTADSASQRCRLLRVMRVAPPIDAGSPGALHAGAAVAAGPLRDAIEQDAQEDDRQACSEALAEVLALGKAGDDVVAQRSRSNEGTNHDH